jgi:hypothetical protein
VVDVELRSPIFNEESGQIEWRTRALVRADGADVELYRPAGGAVDCAPIIDTAMDVVDIATGEVVSSSDGAERWARNLPYAFRSGDMVAVVVHDDDPAATPPASTNDEPTPEIPAPPVAKLHSTVH